MEVYLQKINKRAEKFASGLRSQGDDIIENISPMFLKFALAAICGKWYENSELINWYNDEKTCICPIIDAIMDFDVDSVSPEEEERFRDAFIDLSAIAMYR